MVLPLAFTSTSELIQKQIHTCRHLETSKPRKQPPRSRRSRTQQDTRKSTGEYSCISSAFVTHFELQPATWTNPIRVQQETNTEETVSRWKLPKWVAAGGIIFRREGGFRQLRGQLFTELPCFIFALFKVTKSYVDLPASIWEIKIIVSVHVFKS